MSLLSFQESHFNNLITALDKHGVALDASDTGTGKTYVACSIAKAKGLHPIIICPKAILSNWNRVANEFGIKILGISNYESIRTGNWFSGLGKEPCPYYNKDTHEWSGLPANTMFIFDEVHCCKNKSTLNSKVLMATTKSKCPLLLLSATVADKVEYFSVISYLLDFCKSENLYDMQLRCYRRVNPTLTDSQILHAYTFTEHGSRMRINSIKGMPDNIILPEVYDLDETRQKSIAENYELLNNVKKEKHLQKKEAGSRLTKILRARQHIELVKVPLITELANQYLSEGKSVVIFVNFKDTMDLLIAELNVKCQIRGGQSTLERDNHIKMFQTNVEKIIICMIQSGGVGISLHDTDGAYPRVSIISPPWSAQELVQALGRISRAGGKSKCIQKIVYCSGCIEERIKTILEDKIKVYHGFNDNTLEV